VVGYDTTDPDQKNHYWTLLNSWGDTSKRPLGTFRIPMYLDYQGKPSNYSWTSLQFSPIYTTFEVTPTPTPTITPTVTPTVTPTTIPTTNPSIVICSEGVSDQGCAIGKYSWSGLTVTITKPGEYRFAANVQNDISIEVISSGVTIDGDGVTVRHIAGQPDLDLKNIIIDVDDPNYPDSAITECRNIVNSFIFVRSASEIAGIGRLYGNIDETTSITIMSTARSAYGVRTADGTISGGRFTITSHNGSAYGVYELSGNGVISAGKFTVIGRIDAKAVGKGCKSSVCRGDFYEKQYTGPIELKS
jgi:hypothetical protein